jgi:sugar phosphate isomerase/epimerase
MTVEQPIPMPDSTRQNVGSTRRQHNRRSMRDSPPTAPAGGGHATGSLRVDEATNQMKTAEHRFRQSIAHWCFQLAGEHWDLRKTCEVARQLGCSSVELVPPDQWPVLREYGLVCAMTPNGMPDPPFQRGFNNPRHRGELVHRTKQAIDLCAEAGAPNVIAFIGYKWIVPEDPSSGEIDRAEGADECVRGLKEVVGYAEQKQINLCVEILNTRVDSHPMKGHPGYQGDDLDYVAEIIRRVGSPRLRLLFDVYHVQVMHGDVVRRIEETKDILEHVHVAGHPGRGELDDQQEIDFAAVTQQLVDIGYRGFIGQEFIPTRDPIRGLREAIGKCSA